MAGKTRHRSKKTPAANPADQESRPAPEDIARPRAHRPRPGPRGQPPAQTGGRRSNSRNDHTRRPPNVKASRPANSSSIPAHGVGQIVAIEEQEVAGAKLELFVINFVKDKMTLRVPTAKAAAVGMRKLAEGALVKRALETLKGRARVKRTMWSRRAQEYEAKINSGDIVAIAEVVRDLFRSDTQPEQSYSRASALRGRARPALARDRCGAAHHRDRGDQGDRGGARQGPAPRSRQDRPKSWSRTRRRKPRLTAAN